MKWILLLCLLFSGCSYNRQIKIVSDITPDGKVTYHAELTAEF